MTAKEEHEEGQSSAIEVPAARLKCWLDLAVSRRELL